jgi:hypothetical protein
LRHFYFQQRQIQMSNSSGHRPRRCLRQAQEPPKPVENGSCGDSRPRLSASRSEAFHRELSTKRRGELAELAFLHKATALGFRLSKPYGDSDRYDFITDSGNRLYRVQIKCTTQFLNGHYHLNTHRRIHGKAVPYTLDEIDFFGALVIPENSWFLIPLSHVLGITSLLLPQRKARTHPYQRYREAWPLLCEPDGLTFG